MNSTEFKIEYANSKKLTIQELDNLLFDEYNYDDFTICGMMSDNFGNVSRENIYFKDNNFLTSLELIREGNEAMLIIQNLKDKSKKTFSFDADRFDEVKNWAPSLNNFQDQMFRVMLKNTLQLAGKNKFNVGA